MHTLYHCRERDTEWNFPDGDGEHKEKFGNNFQLLLSSIVWFIET